MSCQRIFTAFVLSICMTHFTSRRRRGPFPRGINRRSDKLKCSSDYDNAPQVDECVGFQDLLRSCLRKASVSFKLTLAQEAMSPRCNSLSLKEPSLPSTLTSIPNWTNSSAIGIGGRGGRAREGRLENKQPPCVDM